MLVTTVVFINLRYTDFSLDLISSIFGGCLVFTSRAKPINLEVIKIYESSRYEDFIKIKMNENLKLEARVEELLEGE